MTQRLAESSELLRGVVWTSEPNGDRYGWVNHRLRFIVVRCSEDGSYWQMFQRGEVVRDGTLDECRDHANRVIMEGRENGL